MAASLCKGRYTLDDNLQQRVAATDHSMWWTGRATSCSNKVRRHVAATNSFVCTGEFLGKSLSLQRKCRCNKSQKIKSGWICVTCCGDKILLQRQRSSQKLSSTREAICLCDMSPHRVAATSRPTCSHGAICRRDVLLQLVALCVPTLTDRLEATQKRPFCSLRNSPHFATSPLVSPPLETSAEIPDWRHVTTQIWVILVENLPHPLQKHSPDLAFKVEGLKFFFAIRANIARRAKNLTEVKGKGADSSRVFSYHFAAWSSETISRAQRKGRWEGGRKAWP